MDIAELEKKVDKAVADFKEALGEEYSEFDRTPANRGDIRVLANETSVALESFRNSIIEYLKSNA